MTTEEIEAVVEAHEPITREQARAIIDTAHVEFVRMEPVDAKHVVIKALHLYPIPMQGPTRVELLTRGGGVIAQEIQPRDE